MGKGADCRNRRLLSAGVAYGRFRATFAGKRDGDTKEFAKKLEDYERSAILVVVLLNPKKEHFIIRRPGCDDETATAKILTFAELPGLKLNAGAIYADCNRR